MKIIICGPQHSGKSVFIANLVNMLPRENTVIIRACPDGESSYSNSPNQEEIQRVRIKGDFTSEFVEKKCREIRNNSSRRIVIVDVGGKISKENERFFKECDAFIVLSASRNIGREWLEFGENLGLRCIANVNSVDPLTTTFTNPNRKFEKVSRKQRNNRPKKKKNSSQVSGVIIGLDRGKYLRDSELLKELSEKICDITRDEVHAPIDANLNFLDFAERLGYVVGCDEDPNRGRMYKNGKFPESDIGKVYRQIYDLLKGLTNVKDESFRLSEFRANFMIGVACIAFRELGVENVSSFDQERNGMRKILKLDESEDLIYNSSADILYHKIESKDTIFIDIDVTGDGTISDEEYSKIVLPKVPKGKKLFISGNVLQVPNVLWGSIAYSSTADEIYYYQPGEGFTCVKSQDVNNLGLIIPVDDVKDIDIVQYQTDKKTDIENEKRKRSQNDKKKDSKKGKKVEAENDKKKDSKKGKKVEAENDKKKDSKKGKKAEVENAEKNDSQGDKKGDIENTKNKNPKEDDDKRKVSIDLSQYVNPGYRTLEDEERINRKELREEDNEYYELEDVPSKIGHGKSAGYNLGSDEKRNGEQSNLRKISIASNIYKRNSRRPGE